MSNSGSVKNNKKKFRWVNLLMFALAIFFVTRIGGQIHEYSGLIEEKKYYEQQLELVEAAYEEQLAEEELLNNDAYIERLAREKLGMVKAGESVVSVVDTDQPSSDSFSSESVYSGNNDYDVDSNPE